jgi:hypothetical protein
LQRFFGHARFVSSHLASTSTTASSPPSRPSPSIAR